MVNDTTTNNNSREATMTDVTNTNAVTNNPNQKGTLAAPKAIFGDHGRFAIAPVHTRFDAVEWFVWDAETTDDLGLATVIREACTGD